MFSLEFSVFRRREMAFSLEVSVGRPEDWSSFNFQPEAKN